MLTPYDSADDFLYLVMLAWAVLGFNILFSLVNAVGVAVIGIFFSGFGSEVDREKNEARDTLVNTLDLFSEWADVMADVVVKAITNAVTIFFTFFFFFCLAAILHLSYLYSPSTLGAMTQGWNNSVGTFWTTYVLDALEAVQSVFGELVGLYNFAVFLLLKLPSNLLFHMFAGGWTDLYDAGLELAKIPLDLKPAVENWWASSAALCKPNNASVIDTSCMNAELMQLDVYPALVHINNAAVKIIDFFPRKCAIVEQPLTLLLYPLTDHELSSAVHYAVNAVTQFFQSIVIAQRRFASENRRESFIFPDFAPVFNNLVFGLVHLGRMVDNWLDMAYYMVYSVSNPGEGFKCDRLDGTWNFDAEPELDVFGKNYTVITALTEDLYAVTDGHSVEYRHHGRRSRITTSLGAWPIDVNVSYGIAAVSYARDASRDEVGSGHTTALFGCSCVDNYLKGIQVTCAIVPYENIEGVSQQAFLVNMTWEVANTPKRMSCRKTKISVQSLRFVPQQITSPVEFANIPSFDPPLTCMERGLCTKVDAAVWMMPVCPLAHDSKFSSVGGDSGCLRSLKDFSCFPFCLGVRRSFSANERIVIRSSNAWEHNVLLTSRDCVLEAAQNGEDFAARGVAEVLDEDENARGTWALHSQAPDVPTQKIKGDPSRNTKCNVNENVVSSIPMLVQDLFDSSNFFYNLSAYGPGFERGNTGVSDFYRSDDVTDAMLAEHQPFVFAGDMALRTATVCTNKLWDDDDTERTCTTVLDVLKITGNEYNEFQLRHIVPSGMAVAPRPTVARQTPQFLVPGMVTLPPTIVRSVYLHNPATATRDAIWYAVNPDYENIHCMMRYCREIEGAVSCMQFSVLSNYDRLRIWKVSPYAGCERNPQNGGMPLCPAHAAVSIAFTDEFSDPIPSSSEFDVGAFCDDTRIFNFYINSMERLDSLNIIVTVRRGNMQGLFDELFGEVTNSEVTARAWDVHYFVHTQTMEMREELPWTDVPFMMDGVGYLCDDFRVMPSLGSAVAETIATGVHLLKMVVGAFMSSGFMYEIYRDPSNRCNLITLRHSGLSDCGSKIFDLSDMFDAIMRGNAYAWQIVDFGSLMFERVVDEESASALTLFLSGMRMQQEEKVILSKTALTSGFVDSLGSGAEKFVAGASNSKTINMRQSIISLGSPQLMAGMSLTVSPIAMAEFTYRTFMRVVDRIITLSKGAYGSGVDTGMTLKYVGGNITTVLYETILTDWQDLIILRARRTCSGISLMMGYSNTWAKFVRHWCLAGVEMSNGMMQTFASVTVELPFVICVCKRSVGHDFSTFVRDVCVAETAPSIKPMAIAMLAFEHDIIHTGAVQNRDFMQYMCANTFNEFDSKLHGLFDAWAEQHLRAGEATMSMLDYIGVLMGRESEDCVSLDTNPSVSVIIPMPLDYFRICGVTNACKSFCSVYQTQLDAELGMHFNGGIYPEIKFQAPIESPMFDRTLAMGNVDPYVRLVAFMELKQGHADCPCATVSADCVSFVGIPYGSFGDPTDHLVVRSFCIPSGLEERVYKVREWKISEDTTGFAMRDFLNMDTSSRLIRVSYSIPYGDHIIMLSKKYGYSSLERNEEYVGSFEAITATRSWQGLGTKLIVSSASIAQTCSAELLNAIVPAIDSDLGMDLVHYDVLVQNVKIMDFIDLISTEYTIDMVVKVDVTVKFLEKAVPEAPAIENTIATSIRVGWCEYLPDNYPGSRHTEPTFCQGIWTDVHRCHVVDPEFGNALMNNWLVTGNLVYAPSIKLYLWVPEKRMPGSVKYDRLRLMNISAADGGRLIDHSLDETYYLSNTVLTNKALGGQGYTIVHNPGIDPTGYMATKFSRVAHWKNNQRDSYGVESLWYSTSSIIVTRDWLVDIRYDASVLVLRGMPSRKKVMDVEVARYCNGHSCQGCATIRLKQMCTNLQMCMTTRCIGTIVNHESIICDLGMLMESMYSQSTAMYIAGWHAVASIMVSVLERSAIGADASSFRVDWISDVFYTTICESKDITARLTSFIATLMNKGINPTTAEDAGQATGTVSSSISSFAIEQNSAANSEAYTSAPLQIAATHQMIFQISLAPLYSAIAFYRWGVCLVNDVISMATEDRFYLSIDSYSADAGVTWGACSTQDTIEHIMQAANLAAPLERLTNIINDAFNDESTSVDIASSLGITIVPDPPSMPGVPKVSVPKVPSAWRTDKADVTNGDNKNKNQQSGAAAEDDTDSGDDDDDDNAKKKKKSSKPTNQKKGGKNPIKSIRPINLLLQLFDAGVAWCIGVLTGVQDVVYTNDDPQCQVQDVTAGDSVQCACGDSPAWIIPDHRKGKAVDGALWCSGVLFMPNNYGKFVHVYNPYSLDEIGRAIRTMDSYLECISSSLSYAQCFRPYMIHFETQDISTMSVLTRCRSNYVQRQWDAGTFALFRDDFIPVQDYNSYPIAQARADTIAWAQTVSDEFHSCIITVTDATDFHTCLQIYLRTEKFVRVAGHNGEQPVLVQGRREETYWAYESEQTDALPGSPDACILFTGPSASASTQETRDLFGACLEDSSVFNQECALPLVAWSGNIHGRVPIGVLHRDAITNLEKRLRITNRTYNRAQSDITTAFDEFFADTSSLKQIDSLFFSAEGDALHQMMDCMFLGPYSRIDYVIADPDGVLETIKWFRDNSTGETREFDLPCTGEKLHGDTRSSPFTCGSQARRSVIKYYVRDVLFNKRSASNVTAELILQTLRKSRDVWTNMSNYGCRAGNSISVENCGDPLYGGMGWMPALDDFGKVSSSEVAEEVFEYLEDYYVQVMTNTEPWYAYYTDEVHTTVFGDWKGTSESKEFHLFEPHEPIVSYDNSEGFNSNNGSSLKHSMWGICTSLLAQPYMTVPLVKYETDGSGSDNTIPAWMPKFIREESLGEFDPVPERVEDLNAWINGLLHDAWTHSPMYSHYAARYMPSLSMVCDAAISNLEYPDPDDESVAKQEVEFTRDTVIMFDDTETRVHTQDDPPTRIPMRGYNWYPIGAVSRMCPCAETRSTERATVCTFSNTTCEGILRQVPETMTEEGLVADKIAQPATRVSCLDNGGLFHQNLIPVVLTELWTYGETLDCPELRLSDVWGFFPYNSEGRNANENWVLRQDGQFISKKHMFDSSDLLAYRRSGITPSNLKHVKDEIHRGTVLSHHARKTPLTRSSIRTPSQRICKNPLDDTLHPPLDENSLINDFIDYLFPVAQLVYEQPGVTTCMRYLLEYVKLKFASGVLFLENVQELEESAALWKERCDIKVKQTIVCNNLGIFDLVPPNKRAWMAERAADCSFQMDDESFESFHRLNHYVTPSCIMYVDGTLYNLHRCRKLNDTLPFTPLHLVPECQLTKLHGTQDGWKQVLQGLEGLDSPPPQANPRALVHPYGGSPMHWGDGSQFAEGSPPYTLLHAIKGRHENVRTSPIGVDLNKHFVHALFEHNTGGESDKFRMPKAVFGNSDPNVCRDGELSCGEAEFCDRTIDWWPEYWEAPYGYHPTASCMARDNAYRTFDSYIAFDREQIKSVYEDTMLRSASKFTKWLGAGGVCRAHSVRMPLFETNTHRVCSQHRKFIPNLAFPADRRDPDPANPLAGEEMTQEECSLHSSDVPWDNSFYDPSRIPLDLWTVGGVTDLLRSTRRKSTGLGRVVNTESYPSTQSMDPELDTLEDIVQNAKTPVFPLAGLPAITDPDEPWGGCVPPTVLTTCTVSDHSSCGAEMVCAQHPLLEDNTGVCMDQGIGTPCFRSDMCKKTEHCLVEGICGRVQMHLWNLHSEAVEFTRLHNETCGMETELAHPFTQDFKGASPWETVPDILRGHGMCAQRHQYSYAYAMGRDAEYEQNPDSGDRTKRAFVRAKANAPDHTYIWPWLQQTPGGQLLADDSELDYGIMKDVRFMHVHPHVCDRDYMHHKDFKACSGERGEKDRPLPVYSVQQEDLNQDNFLSWSNLDWRPGAHEENKKLEFEHWMRTHDPGNDKQIDERFMTVGTLFDTMEYKARGAFAFLGGDASLSVETNTYESSTGHSTTKFIRCATIRPCGMPRYTYNGVKMERGMYMLFGDKNSWHVQTTSDVVQCGAIGMAMNIGECRFDLALFPLLRMLITTQENPCTRIYGSIGGAVGHGIIDYSANMPTDCPPTGVICCTGVGFDSLWCKYPALTQVQGLNSKLLSVQEYSSMIEKLNHIHILGTVSLDVQARRQSLDVATDLAECIDLVWETSQIVQSDLFKIQYRRPLERGKPPTEDNQASGLYHVLRYSMYEVPWLWYYKYAYKTLVWSSIPPIVSIPTHSSNWGTLQYEGGLMQLGEAWTSRVGLFSSTGQVLPCQGIGKCSCSFAQSGDGLYQHHDLKNPMVFRDRLLCMNGAARRKTHDDVGGEERSIRQQKEKFFQMLQQAIENDVKKWLAENHNIDGTRDPLEMQAGCFTEAHWNISQCRESAVCLEAIVSASLDNNAEEGVSLNPNDFERFFTFKKFERNVVWEDLNIIIRKIVESIEFESEDFDAINAPVETNLPFNAIPFFRMLDEPVFNEVGAWTEWELHERYSFVSWRPEVEYDDEQCIIEGPDMHPLESALYNVMQGNTRFDQPAEAVFYKRDNTAHYIDLCASDSMYETYDRDKHPLVTGRYKRMSCSFQTDPKHVGRDYCDTEEATFPMRLFEPSYGGPLDSFKTNSEGDTLFASGYAGPPEFGEAMDMYSSKMVCDKTPYMQASCIDSGITQSVSEIWEGPWQQTDTMSWWSYVIETDHFATERDNQCFGRSLVGKQCPFPESYRVFGSAHYLCDGQTITTPTWGDGSIVTCKLQCPATILSWEAKHCAPDLYIPSTRQEPSCISCGNEPCDGYSNHIVYNQGKDLDPRKTGVSYVEQKQPTDHLCHRVDQECFPDSFVVNLPDEGKNGKCDIARVDLPPGIAAKFYAHDQDPSTVGGSSATARERGPQWRFCPKSNNHYEYYAHEGPGGMLVPTNPKNDFTAYNQITDPVIRDCTKQQATVLYNGGGCSRFDSDDCYVGHMWQDSKWDIDQTTAELCATFQGACSYSLSYIKGFRCMTTTEMSPGSCDWENARHRYYHVRGDTSRRALYRCMPCLKYRSEQYEDGNFKCGYSGQNDDSSDGFTREGIISLITEYLRGKMTSTVDHKGMHYVKELMQDFPDYLFFGAKKDALPIIMEGANVAYIRTDELSFAKAFEGWGPTRGLCKSAVSTTTSSTSETECSWTGQYDISHIMALDKEIDAGVEALKCSVESPQVHEYGRCSDSNTTHPRRMLQEWVDDVYREQQGTWMHVLEPEKGTQWKVDRSGVNKPFTLMFAVKNRNPLETHATYVLGDHVCTQGIHERAICASVGLGQARRISLVNPWMGGEFNPWLQQESSHGMGLDQCFRDTGVWEVGCSCFPVSRCCYPEAQCPSDHDFEPNIETERHNLNYFQSPQHDTHCKLHDFHSPPTEAIPNGETINICLRDAFKHHADICVHYQGIVGGTAGRPVRTIEKLYHETETNIAIEIEDFLVAEEVVLWRGALASESVSYLPGKLRLMRMPDNLMYASHIVFVVPGNTDPMRLHSMQMQAEGGKLYEEQLPVPVASWMPLMRDAYTSSNNHIRPLYPILNFSMWEFDLLSGGTWDPAKSQWHCPFRMSSFWGKHTPGFNPLVPDPVESETMFGRQYYCIDGRQDQVPGGCIRGVHPYHENIEFENIRDYYTTDGSCFFDPKVTGEMLTSFPNLRSAQQVPHSNGDNPCGLRRHLERVLKDKSSMSHVMSSVENDCTQKVDWGGIPLTYRSGEPPKTPYAAEPQSCGMLSRLQPFVMRLKHDHPILASETQTTSSDGGDCHMGRATRVNEEVRNEILQYELCLTVARTTTQASIRCTGRRRRNETIDGVPVPITGAAQAAYPDRIFLLEREVRPFPSKIVDGTHAGLRTKHSSLGDQPRRRTTCGECDTSNIVTQGPGHGTLEYAETSIGVMHRLSGKEMLANELMKHVSNRGIEFLNQPEWGQDVFLRNLFMSPDNLVTGMDENGKPEARTQGLQADIDELLNPVSDTPLWSYPWVLYLGAGDAVGSIAQSDWVEQRFQTCNREILDEVKKDETGTFVRSIRICDVTGPLQKLCEKLHNIRLDIANANCITQGDDCEILETYYTPAQWSPTNKAFARETVRDFYQHEAEDACAGETDRVLLAQEENKIMNAACGATQLEFMKQALQLARLAVRMIMAAVTSFNAIMLDFIMLVFAAIPGVDLNPTDILDDILRHIAILFRLLVEAIYKAMDIMIFILSQSPVGEVIAKIFWAVCTAVTWVFEVVVRGFLCNIYKFTVNNIIVGMVDFIENMLSTLNPFGDVTIPGWQTARTDILIFGDSLPCNSLEGGHEGIADGSVGCHMDGMDVGPQDLTKAFVPTRCWANPTFGDLFGESNALGCSSTDTCILDEIGGDTGVCEQCGTVDISVFSRYGCDVGIRRCRCSVPIQLRMPCIRNSDCRADVPCRMMADPDAPSFGTFNCLECTGEPMCLIDEPVSDGLPPTGECTCLMTPPRMQTCVGGPAGMYQPIVPGYGVCLVARDRSVADTISINTQILIETASLAYTACPLLGRSRSHLTCQQVRSPSGAVANMMVGTQMIRIPSALNRRLLWESPYMKMSRPWENIVPQILKDTSLEQWEGAGDCYDLVKAYRIRDPVMGVLDRNRLRDCVKWRAVANVTIAMYNLTRMDDRVLLSWNQMLNTWAVEAIAMMYHPSGSLLLDPLRYTEAGFYIASQLDDAETFIEVSRKVFFSFRSWIRSVSLTIKNRMQRVFETGTQKANATSNANASSAAGRNQSQWNKSSAISGLALHSTVRSWTRGAQTRRKQFVRDNLARTPIDHDEISHRIRQAGRGLLQSKLWDDPLRFEWDWSVDWENLKTQWENEEQVCELWDIASDSVSVMWGSMQDYYNKSYPRPNRSNINTSIYDTFMSSPQATQEQIDQELKPPIQSEGLTGALLNEFAYGVQSLTGLKSSHISAFFDPADSLEDQISNDLFTFPRILNDLTKCDFRRIMLCTSKPKSLLSTSVIALMLLWGLAKILQVPTTFGIIMILLGWPWMVMWYAYGYSPTCFPMIPTCFIEDIVNTLKTTIPETVTWPALVIKQEHCNLQGAPLNPNSTVPGGCFRSCSEPQFRFVSWQDPFAWWLCELNLGWCQTVADTAARYTPLADDYRSTTYYFMDVLNFNDLDLTNAHRFCGVFTGFYIIPAMLAVLWGIIMAGAFVKAAITVLLKTAIYIVKSRTNAPGESTTIEEDAEADQDEVDADEQSREALSQRRGAREQRRAGLGTDTDYDSTDSE